LDLAFPDAPWIRAVFAMSLDGAIVGPDESSRSISTPADQRWFAALRREADVHLVGAGTFRSEDYRPSASPVAIVTRTLDLPPTLRTFSERTEQHAPILVLTTDEMAVNPPVHLAEAGEVLGCGSGRVDLRRAKDRLVERGLGRIQCEGGPHLLADLVRAGLLDELFLTVMPELVGGATHLLMEPDGLFARMQIADWAVDDGSTLLRLLPTGGSAC
jgi:riboflavin biosynthesis pyrimidine reductase